MYILALGGATKTELFMSCSVELQIIKGGSFWKNAKSKNSKLKTFIANKSFRSTEANKKFMLEYLTENGGYLFINDVAEV